MKILEIQANLVQRLTAFPIHEPQTMPPGSFEITNMAQDLRELNDLIDAFTVEVNAWAVEVTGCEDFHGSLNNTAYALDKRARDIHETQAETAADRKNDERRNA
jgi:hypothetical protein